MWVNCDLNVLDSIIIITQMCIHQQELKDDNIFGFVLSTSIPRFKFLHVCFIFPILISIFERLVLNA